MKEYPDLLVALDIGTAKILAVVAEPLPQGGMRLLALGHADSVGLKGGVVVDIRAAVHSIQQALTEAELMAACKITRVVTGISGDHIRSFNSSGVVRIKNPREVRQRDIDAVLDAARAVPIPAGRELLLDRVQEYTVDTQVVREPLGMGGVRLQAQVHLATGSQMAAENTIRCIHRCGLSVAQSLQLNALASAQAVLTPDERELGVAVLDIGAGTSDLAVFSGGVVRYTGVLGTGGALITQDIADMLKTPLQVAEDLKMEGGCAKHQLADPEASLEVWTLGAQQPGHVTHQVLSGCIEQRARDIFEPVRDVLGEDGDKWRLPAGVVLTGGSAAMPGMVELARDILLRRVRLGTPRYDGPLADMVAHPRAATAMGLLEEAQLQRLHAQHAAQKITPFKRAWHRASDFWRQLF